MNSKTEHPSLGTMHTDQEFTRMLPFEVSEQLASMLTEQREMLDLVDPSQSAQSRYIVARESGVFAALAKGAKNRALRPDEIFLPKSEVVALGNGKVRITALKATIGVPPDAKVKNVIFTRTSEGWKGHVTVAE